MYFNISKVFAGSLLLLLFYCPYSESADNKTLLTTVLSAQPTSCITLHQGRKCYTNITIDWQSSIMDDYCLYQEKTVIHCWPKSKKDKTFISFESEENVTFYLAKRNSDVTLAETTITIGWVHKATPRKRRWRLF